ncbi:MAG TPA: hypothetical protein VE397_07165 [Stellaceae bacterium]|nr:hypothetical protein [Stellaceae bacterium]
MTAVRLQRRMLCRVVDYFMANRPDANVLAFHTRHTGAGSVRAGGDDAVMEMRFTGRSV